MLARRAIPRLQQPFRQFAQRTFSTAELSNGIKMAYEKYEPESGQSHEGAPVVFVHGLFGSKRNHRSISKQLVRDLKRPIYAVDTRNHGDSSHDPRHDYTALAEDLELFLQQEKIKDGTLIGHSMGAKVVMTVALRKKVPIGHLIPVDNAPVDAALKSDFAKYTVGMRKIEEAGVKSLRDADKILSDYEQSLPIRQFLLTNLMHTEDGTQKFRVPLKYLTDSLDKLGDFPFKDPDEARWGGPTLIVRGSRSRYVADDMLPICGRFFPKFELSTIDAGHWVISEKPEEFRQAVVEWLLKKE
ncbi:Abhydrolase domain-containing [Lecanosticta acicola]|uniref:Abhydrolase domain-containing n=1 Tax=Lecanosticta acicola TaxID=111012 RepID=A0AAI8YSW6_9PEZI|nr:Abhydrolase domain-containing [Lecanosticta acicola]